VLSTSAVRELTDPVTQADAAVRTRELSGAAVASWCRAAGSDPVRRGGSKPGGCGGWAIGVEGRKVLLPLSPANSASSESGRDVLRD
jgi:hypothetical protein